MHRRHLLNASTALAAAFCAPWAQAQSAYPSKVIRIVVPFGAGGVADLTARMVGQKLSTLLGQSVIIDNRPGAGGVVAGDLVAKAPADGYTLLLMSNATAVSPSLFKKLPFDAQKDFAPISLLGLFELAIVVPEKSRFKTLAELLAWAHAHPGQLNIGSINVGSTQNLAAELFRTRAGVDVQVVPFNGTPAVLTALRGGQVDAAVEVMSPVMPHILNHTVRALAVMGSKRSAALPNVPTVAESGAALADFQASSWNALAAPAKTAPEVIAKLTQAVQEALATPEVRQQLEALYVEPRASTPAQLGQLLANDTQRWAEVVKRANIQPQ